MSEKIQKLMNDSPAARWTALILIALMMFFGYMFVDVMSPLQALIEQQRGWSPDVFGTYASAEYILNVCGFLILAGIILDKMGVRFTGILSASMMFIGASSRYNRLVPDHGFLRVARNLVGLNARQRQNGRPWLYDLRMRLRDGRHDSLQGHRQMV